MEKEPVNDTQNQEQKEKPKFDWVTQRSSCSLPNVFKELRLQIEDDVKTRNGLRPTYAPYEFSVADIDGGFKVLLQSKDVEMVVTFILAEHGILVRDDKGVQMFEVKLSFSDQGECQLMVNGEAREYWQVRRMALEELMFRGN
jgi:hypothetical protein